MSALSAQLAQAAQTANRVLAPLADPDNDGTVTIAGTSYTNAVTNLRTVAMEPTPNGFRRIEELDIALPRADFATAPSAAPRPAVTALGRAWLCTAVSPAGPNWILTCVPA